MCMWRSRECAGPCTLGRLVPEDQGTCSWAWLFGMWPPPAAASAINPALFRNVRRLQVLSLMSLPFSPTDVMHRGEVPISDHGMELHSTYLKASAPPTAVSRSRVIRRALHGMRGTKWGPATLALASAPASIRPASLRNRHSPEPKESPSCRMP